MGFSACLAEKDTQAYMGRLLASKDRSLVLKAHCKPVSALGLHSYSEQSKWHLPALRYLTVLPEK